MPASRPPAARRYALALEREQSIARITSFTPTHIDMPDGSGLPAPRSRTATASAKASTSTMAASARVRASPGRVPAGSAWSSGRPSPSSPT